eukprot:scaffold25591_cov72-Phaeocystis_antarctica.AAC.5
MAHPHQVGLGLADLVVAHAEEARLVVAHAQCQPLRLRLLPRLLARQRRGRRRRHCSLGRRRLPLRRLRDAQRRPLGGAEAAQVHVLSTALHLRPIGLGLAGVGEVHAEEARLVVRNGQQVEPPLRVLGGVNGHVTASEARWSLGLSVESGHSISFNANL